MLRALYCWRPLKAFRQTVEASLLLISALLLYVQRLANISYAGSKFLNTPQSITCREKAQPALWAVNSKEYLFSDISATSLLV